MKHTKGTWTVEKTKNGFRIQRYNKIICWEHKEGYKNLLAGKANAKFIVQACNSHYELLGACKKIMAEINKYNDVKMKLKTFCKLQQAIAKAEGDRRNEI